MTVTVVVVVHVYRTSIETVFLSGNFPRGGNWKKNWEVIDIKKNKFLDDKISQS